MPVKEAKEEDLLLQKINLSCLPRHIAIIMDGNGRWARKRGLARVLGHRAGAESVRSAIESCGALGIEALTLYAFSEENWVRPVSEVAGLMDLLSRMLRSEVSKLDAQNVRLRAIGRLEKLPERVRRELSLAQGRLAKNTGIVVTLALSYGGRQEIVDAVNRVIESGARRVTEEEFSRFLYTGDLRDPDLVIRTSGEMRVSNFLLYQIAYSELYVTPTLWPDFRKRDLYEAVLDYQKRERRFGGS